MTTIQLTTATADRIHDAVLFQEGSRQGIDLHGAVLKALGRSADVHILVGPLEFERLTTHALLEGYAQTVESVEELRAFQYREVAG